ncbi:hypothetical protein [Geminocystis sp. NIES-3709]|uniref:hypothetical protein n=1 Tax=Geminocystis sp. NIES-3709 TaxID=1617448 RepID=UPI0005FC8385|nr:hypothetical protein [Geminocystis sp. NIES-3709]BAQ63310.1 hypothetical protein GM3709_75 [Geminocystis sp. NIES-3709]
MIQNSLSSLLLELESHCNSTAIVTFLDSDGEVFVVDLIRKNNQVNYGYQKGIKEKFMLRLMRGVQTQASIILRSFTDEIDQYTNLPIKELRGYILRKNSDRIEFNKISPKMMFACHNTDAQTGEPRPLEQSVRYC